jgi:lipopolysaccharide export system permease protein
MIGRLLRPLDRYVFAEFWKIFIVTSLGFPILLIIIDLTDNVEKYLNRNVPAHDIALSYVYFIPDSMFMVLPAAVLFATVFSIGSLTRHAEITAAKASGISFYRLIAPVLLGATFACGLDLALGEVVPITNVRRAALLDDDKARGATYRYNFAFASEDGRVIKARQLRTDSGLVRSLQIERKGKGPTYPTYLLTADIGNYLPSRAWQLHNGSLDVIPDSAGAPIFSLSFASGVDWRFREQPADMMSRERGENELQYAELTRAIVSRERSGTDTALLRVTRALKIAVPVTCIIIALFGAPLATSTQRGGSAYGIAVSLATTMIFLLMIQLTKAIGLKGVLPPDLAAWIPSAIFGALGLVLLARVRT